MANSAQDDDYRANANLSGGRFTEQLRRLTNGPQDAVIDNSVRTILTNTASGALTTAEAVELLSGTALSAEDVARVSAGTLPVDAALSRLRRSRYADVAYADHLRNYPTETPEADIKLARLTRYAEGAEPENDSPTFLLDAVVWIQGVNVSEFIMGDISVSSTGISGTNEVSFTLANDSDRFIWTERNLASIYGPSAIRGGADYVREFASGLTREQVRALDAAAFENLSSGDIDVGFEALAANPAFLKLLTDRAFTQGEDLKRQMFEYKANATRNPPIRNPKNTICFARYDLAPGRAIFNRMDPVRIFTLYPFRAAGAQYEADRPELWLPEFTGYVETQPIEDDDINGRSTVSVSCSCIRASVLRRMRLSGDISTGIENPLEEMGFRSGPISTDRGAGPQNAKQRAIQEQIAQSSDKFFDINSTQFYDDVIATPYSHSFPDQPLERAVRELLVVKEPITVETNKRGVRNITFGGNFYYDSASTSQELSREFLSQWHKFCLFGPKRRPWTRSEMEEVGKGTTTDGPYAPNRIRLWFLLPKEGTGAKNLADLSSATMQVSHQIDWTNRLEVLQSLVEPVDYCLQVTPCGDIVVEFTMADFRPEDFGEFKETFRVDKALKSSGVSDEQEVPPAGLIVTHGFGRAAGQPPSEAQPALTKVFVYSPYIAARYGIEVDNDSLPFLTQKDRVVAQQRAVIMYQRRLARAHALNMTFSYRPFLLPNRPLHHLRRGRMGLIVSCEKSLTLGAGPSATTSCGLEHTRLFSGYYRSSEDFTTISDLQRQDLAAGGIDPDDALLIQGIDTVDSSADPYERQIFTTVAGGESTPTSARVGFGPEAVLAPASGIYVLDLQAATKEALGVVPAPADGQQQSGDAVTAVNTPAIDNDATFPSNPLAEMVVTSPFGVTRTIKGLTEDHGGTDLRASVGTPFFAVADGVVERAEFVRDSRSGFLVQLRTDNGYIVQYLHCDEASTRRVVPVGQKVLAGQQIGFTGNTPGTVDPHLHIQVFKIAERNLNKTGALTGSSRGTKLDVMPLLPKTRVARS